MNGTFTLTIELGNEEMKTKRHLAYALREVARKVASGTEEGRIHDINGNTVGNFKIAGS